jgi:hypothetical protein
MSNANVVAARTLAGDPAHSMAVGWCCLLAEMVHSDRDEHVGGTRHARPAK